jgi:hypothetical protein
MTEAGLATEISNQHQFRNVAWEALRAAQRESPYLKAHDREITAFWGKVQIAFLKDTNLNRAAKGVFGDASAVSQLSSGSADRIDQEKKLRGSCAVLINELLPYVSTDQMPGVDDLVEVAEIMARVINQQSQIKTGTDKRIPGLQRVFVRFGDELRRRGKGFNPGCLVGSALLIFSVMGVGTIIDEAFGRRLFVDTQANNPEAQADRALLLDTHDFFQATLRKKDASVDKYLEEVWGVPVSELDIFRSAYPNPTEDQLTQLVDKLLRGRKPNMKMTWSQWYDEVWLKQPEKPTPTAPKSLRPIQTRDLRPNTVSSRPGQLRGRS